MAKPDTTQLQTLLAPAKQVIILLPQHPHYDHVASGLSLKLALESSGKATTVICSDPMTVEFNRLVGVDSVTTTLSNRNLVITFPGQTEQVDKVSYSLEKGELQLVITPKAGVPDLDHRRLKFIPGTSRADLVLLIGVSQLPDLGPLYDPAQELLSSTQIISITHGLPQANYTSAQIFNPEVSSLSELMAQIIESLSLNLHTDIATNLLSGIEITTDNFQSSAVSHTTFEAAAQLLRHGARRHQPLSSASFPPGAIPGQTPVVPPVAPAPLTPPPASSALSGYGTDSSDLKSDSPAVKPPDWYEPKIYHGPMLQ